MNQQKEKPNYEGRWDPELLKKGLYCDLDQYEMLKRCLNKNNITEWNEWRNSHNSEKIWLQGVVLISFLLEHVYFGKAHLERANLANAKLLNCHLYEADLEGANLDMANLQNSFLQGANLQNCFLPLAQLDCTDLINVNLQNAHLVGASLQSTILRETNLRSANFETAIIDGGTLIWNCKVDRETNFEGVGLDNCRIDPATKQLLEYNIRRKNWEGWYREHPKLKWLIKPFWWISDYGLSTKRIISTFFGLALAFAIIYYVFGLIAYPGIVNNLFEFEGSQGPEAVSAWIVPFRAVYFSVVTMTTLGFGDMYANPNSFWGHFFLTFQVILGYVLLGALVTRFAVLFTAGGPAGKFEDEGPQKQ